MNWILSDGPSNKRLKTFVADFKVCSRPKAFRMSFSHHVYSLSYLYSRAKHHDRKFQTLIFLVGSLLNFAQITEKWSKIRTRLRICFILETQSGLLRIGYQSCFWCSILRLCSGMFFNLHFIISNNDFGNTCTLFVSKISVINCAAQINTRLSTLLLLLPIKNEPLLNIYGLFWAYGMKKYSSLWIFFQLDLSFSVFRCKYQIYTHLYSRPYSEWMHSTSQKSEIF